MSGSLPKTGGAGNRLSVSRAEDAVVIQVHGLGNMFLAPTLISFVTSEVKAGFRSFVVDLRYCDGMDSTFMGSFIELTGNVQDAGGWFCLVNVSRENARLLKMLGVLHMVPIHDGDFAMPEAKATTLDPTTDPYIRQKQIHTAHRLLMEADPENITRFGPFIKALEAELADIPTILPPPDDPDSSNNTP